MVHLYRHFSSKYCKFYKARRCKWWQAIARTFYIGLIADESTRRLANREYVQGMYRINCYTMRTFYSMCQGFLFVWGMWFEVYTKTLYKVQPLLLFFCFSSSNNILNWLFYLCTMYNWINPCMKQFSILLGSLVILYNIFYFL